MQQRQDCPLPRLNVICNEGISDTEQKIFKEYWEHFVDDHGNFVFAHKVADIASRVNLPAATVSLLQKNLGVVRFEDLTCQTCGKSVIHQLPPRDMSRGIIRWCWSRVQQVDCEECADEKRKEWQTDREQREARARQRRQLEQDERRDTAKEEWGPRFVGDCPLCDEFLVVKVNSKTLDPFIACTSFHFKHRGCGCGYTQHLPIDEQLRFRNVIFGEMASIVRRIKGIIDES